MTEEQIKSLKIGDKLRTEYSIVGVHKDFVILKDSEDICCTAEKIERGVLARATLVTHAPTFEVGDTVRIAHDPMTGTVHGFGSKVNIPRNKIGKVKEVRESAGEFLVEFSDIRESHTISIHCIELVKKAVKDKYIVRKIRDGWGVARIEEDNFKRSCAEFVEETHPYAKASAEAECARLNEAWRKQQEGGEE